MPVPSIGCATPTQRALHATRIWLAVWNVTDREVGVAVSAARGRRWRRCLEGKARLTVEDLGRVAVTMRARWEPFVEWVLLGREDALTALTDEWRASLPRARQWLRLLAEDPSRAGLVSDDPWSGQIRTADLVKLESVTDPLPSSPMLKRLHHDAVQSIAAGAFPAAWRSLCRYLDARDPLPGRGKVRTRAMLCYHERSRGAHKCSVAYAPVPYRGRVFGCYATENTAYVVDATSEEGWQVVLYHLASASSLPVEHAAALAPDGRAYGEDYAALLERLRATERR